MDIDHKIVIVTGASGGIGLATAQVLATKGATVILAARSQEKLEQITAEIPGAYMVITDMRKQEDIHHLVRTVLEKYGRIDLLINNAGQGLYGSLETINMDQYKEVMELNVYGVLRAMQEVIPHMREQGGGMILNISSLVSKHYFPQLSAYASTKYALNALSLTARQELADDHIIVSVFHPKMTDTDFEKNAVGHRPDYVKQGARLAMDSAEQVAEKIAELIQSEAPELSM